MNPSRQNYAKRFTMDGICIKPTEFGKVNLDEVIAMMTASLKENLAYFNQQFDGSADFIVRKFQITGTDAALLTLEGLVNKQVIVQGIMNPILHAAILEQDPVKKFEYIRDNTLATVDQAEVDTYDAAIQKLMNGFALIAIDGCIRMMAFSVQGFSFRGISEPQNEMTQRGSREGFVEPFLINMSMIRRRMHTPKLKFEIFTVGKESKTNICVCYLRDTVSPKVLSRVKKRIKDLQLNTVLAAGYVSPQIVRKHSHFIFSGVGLSERPDTVCGKINEGRVAIIIDGTPNVLIVPHLFIENFQSFDDYAFRPFYATFTRWLKFFAFFLAVFLPGFYVSATTFHPELLPEELMLKIAQAEATTPFPVMLEAIVIHFLYEIRREAGPRVPQPLSNAVSIVGALVIGETAVSSGLVGAPTLMVIALTATASYVTPTLYGPVTIMRFIFIVVGGTLGFWGLALCLMVMLVNICAEMVYQIPFSAPLSPFKLHSMRDVLVRASWKILSKDIEMVQNMPGSEIKNPDQKGKQV